jgi:hypothetical protein
VSLLEKSASSSRAMKFWLYHLQRNLILKVFFIWQGITYHRFVSENATISKERYKEVFAHLWEALHLKEPEICVTID